MKLHIKLLRVIFVVSFLASSQSQAVARAINLPLEQMAVPHHDTWIPLPFAVVDELMVLRSAEPAVVEALLSSDDPREVGLGLFVLEQNADLARLASLADLLDDQRPTIPYAGKTVQVGDFVPQNQTVGEYLAHIYAMWFGVPSRDAKSRKEEIRNVTDPWERPNPWLEKLTRARSGLYGEEGFAGRETRIAAVKQELQAGSADVRWVVATDGHDRGLYSREEARTILLSLDQTLRSQIITGDPLAARQGQVGWELIDAVTPKARELLQE